METIKKHFTLLLGVGLFITGFFNFSHSTYSGGYFYDSEYIFYLVVGSILITIWLLKNVIKK
jgi:hypothetical protein